MTERSTNPRLLLALRRHLHTSGRRQIEAAIEEVNAQLEVSPALLDQFVLAGRRRELRAARWVLDRLLIRATDSTNTAATATDAIATAAAHDSLPSSPQSPRIEPLPDAANTHRSLQAALLDAIAAKLQFSLHNLTGTPLEIDILKLEKKRELLYLILRKLEASLDDLRFSQVDLEQMEEKRAIVLRDLWVAATTDFFGRYYTLPVGDRGIELVTVLLQDAEIVQSMILDRIPLVDVCLSHLLFQTPLAIEDDLYAAGTLEATMRMEWLLQNLVIQVANAVMQPLLNHVGDVVVIKQHFYDKRLLSSREIERFRNDLSWNYRVSQYIREPIAIFESRFHLIIVQESGLIRADIYAPRNQELAQLTGVQYAVTLALETRDAIAPRLRSAISLLGSGLVYLLTDVIGRGIGLVGRGMIKGIGNALQDGKPTRNSERPR